jgi:hypothetical protein
MGQDAVHVRVEVVRLPGAPPVLVQLADRHPDKIIGRVPIPAVQVRRPPQPFEPDGHIVPVRDLVVGFHALPSSVPPSAGRHAGQRLQTVLEGPNRALQDRLQPDHSHAGHG